MNDRERVQCEEKKDWLYRGVQDTSKQGGLETEKGVCKALDAENLKQGKQEVKDGWERN